MVEVELGAQGGKIKLLIHDSAWCEIHLLANDSVINLGGENLERIISRLMISFIPEKDRKYFIYQDMKLFTVFNLMGPHAVVAGRERDDFGIELIFLSNEGNVIPMVVLSTEDIKEWIAILTKFMISCMHHN